MASLVTAITDTATINALSFRMDPAVPAAPSVPASPGGGEYHIKTPLGWVDISASQMAAITLARGAFT